MVPGEGRTLPSRGRVPGTSGLDAGGCLAQTNPLLHTELIWSLDYVNLFLCFSLEIKAIFKKLYHITVREEASL
jgi:hypothetical protein